MKKHQLIKKMRNEKLEKWDSQKVTSQIDPVVYLTIKTLSERMGISMSKFINLAIMKYAIDHEDIVSSQFIETFQKRLKATPELR